VNFALPARKVDVAPRAAKTGLRIGPSDDAFERDADRVAQEVMEGRGAQWSLSSVGIVAALHRKCACGGSGECEECKKEGTVQRKPAEGAATEAYAPPPVVEVPRSSGQPMETATRAFFEPRFGHDFRNLRVHADAEAARPALAPTKAAATRGAGATDLRITSPNDPFEREADRAADVVMGGGRVNWSIGAMNVNPPVRRKRVPEESSDEAPPVVHEVLGSAGRPMEPKTRAFFESRMGGTRRVDLGGVRIHTGPEAARSAKAVNARAYTVGNDIVFGEGEYEPETRGGRHLLAHELAHVAQRQSGLMQRSWIGDVVSGIGDFFTGVGKAIGRFFGAENYTEKELQAYLAALDEGHTEGHYDSDNKARQITNAWRLGGSPFVLTEQRKALMILEMQQGYTSGDDENAILELLERSYNFELSYMFGTGGLNAKRLNSDISGDNFDRLKEFYENRFEGGQQALLKGSVAPVGYPVPLGTVLPKRGEEGVPIDTLPGAKEGWNEDCVTALLCPSDSDVVQALPGLRVLKTATVTEYFWEYDGHAWNLRTKEHGAFSNAANKVIGFKLDESCAFAASSFVHEVRHQKQPTGMTTLQAEEDAYSFEENWTIERGLPGRSQFRMPKPGGGEQANPQAIEEYVKKHYSGTASAPGEQIIGHKDDGSTEIKKPDGSTYTRPPQQGDTHQDVPKTKEALENAPEADKKKWVCPGKK
jgi:hypothetical protein